MNIRTPKSRAIAGATAVAIAIGVTLGIIFATSGDSTPPTGGLTPLGPDTDVAPGIVQLEPGDTPPPGGDAGATTLGDGPGISIADALATTLSGPLLVNGALVIVDGAVRLCSALAESFPPQCGGDSIPVVGLDITTLDLQIEGNVSWTNDHVQLLGTVHDGVLVIDDSALAAGDAADQSMTSPEDVAVGPSNFPQPNPTVTETDVPTRPDAFADFGATALSWLQTRTSVDAILPLFESWGMPSVAGGFRLHLVDTNHDALAPGDGRSSLVIVFTDPVTVGVGAVVSNLVVYDPLLDAPGQYRIAYDHNGIQDLREPRMGPTEGIVVRSVLDVTGDGARDISFEEVTCVDGGCTSRAYVLSSEGDGYRRTIVDPVVAVAPISTPRPCDIQDWIDEWPHQHLLDSLGTSPVGRARVADYETQGIWQTAIFTSYVDELTDGNLWFVDYRVVFPEGDQTYHLELRREPDTWHLLLINRPDDR